jgi:hypothetical protein
MLVTAKRITIIDEPSRAGIKSGGQTFELNKDRAAAICNCKASDRCWWTALSHKGFPGAVICCPFKDKAGHRSVTDTQHSFSDKELGELRALAGCPNFR